MQTVITLRHRKQRGKDAASKLRNNVNSIPPVPQNVEFIKVIYSLISSYTVHTNALSVYEHAYPYYIYLQMSHLG